ncbi:MAG: redoxin domain-containing protein [Gemmataceae bacterium]|nr:redoxin domain-containing protein [Gemmataceae bacterium]
MRIVCNPAVAIGLIVVFVGSASMTTLAVAGGPKEGKPAPGVELKAALPDGKTGTINLSDYKGKKHVVLYFFPKALTGG